MTAPTMQRVGEVQDLDDDALLAKGLLDMENLEFDRPVNPGDQIFKVGQGDNQFSATATGTDMTPVNIYNIHGEAKVMPRDWAVQRLKKRYPANHPSWPNQPVFYRRPPRAAEKPTIPCPSKWAGGCRKMLFTQLQMEQHMQGRHGSEWRQMEAIRQRDQQERLIAAQEATAAMMREFLAAGGRAPAAVMAQDEEADLVEATPQAWLQPDYPVELLNRPQLMKWMKANGKKFPADFRSLNADQLRASLVVNDGD